MSGSKIPVCGVLLAAVCSLAVVAGAQPRGAATSPSSSTPAYPAWAYAWDPEYEFPPADNAPRRLPGSTAAFSSAQARDLFFSPDWHPGDHSEMPEVVARGRKPDVFACGCCHRAEGTGGPENASLAGLPAAYIARQMADYKSGARRFSGPQRAPVLAMVAVAKSVTDAEVKAAARYFSGLKLKPIVKVVEADLVPRTYVAQNFRAVAGSGGKEPIGRRIIEVPVDVEQFELRDSRAQFLAYVPTGSIARGKALATTGSGTTKSCTACHGQDMRGAGEVPSIAGRSPSYVVRQLHDFKSGARAGVVSALMKPTVQKLTEKDMIALAAYLASLRP